MTLSDELLIGVTVATAAFSIRERIWRPVALALFVYASSAGALALEIPAFAARFIFAAWAGVLPALVWAIWSERWRRIAIAFGSAALLVALVRELPVTAALPEALRRQLFGHAYAFLRLIGLGASVFAWRGCRPRSLPELAALSLGLSTLIDLTAGIWTTDAWNIASWHGVAIPLSAVTWASVGVLLILAVLRK